MAHPLSYVPVPSLSPPHSDNFSCPSNKLDNSSNENSGFVSEKFPSPPLSVTFKLKSHAIIRQFRLLSHSSMIASKIEIHIGYSETKMRRLGFITLDKNERSDFRARELKNVAVDANGKFVKLVLHKCHDNRVNLFNQIGIVAFEVIGVYSGDHNDPPRPPGKTDLGVEDENFDGENDTETHRVEQSMNYDNSSTTTNDDYNRNKKKNTRNPNCCNDEMWRRVHATIDAKDLAVKNQDYALAKKIKAAEAKIRESAARSARLEEAKVEAVSKEDYDRASMLQTELRSLQERAASVMKSLGIELSPLPEVVPDRPEVTTPRKPTGEKQRNLLAEVESNVMMGEDKEKAKVLIPPPPKSPRLKKVMQQIKNANSISRAFKTTVKDAKELEEVRVGLNPSWTAERDPDTGYVYYYNNETEESSWERPPDAADTAAAIVPDVDFETGKFLEEVKSPLKGSPRTEPDANETPSMAIAENDPSVLESLLVQNYVDNQTADGISPRVSEPQRAEPEQTPPVLEEEQPRDLAAEKIEEEKEQLAAEKKRLQDERDEMHKNLMLEREKLDAEKAVLVKEREAIKVKEELMVEKEEIRRKEEEAERKKQEEEESAANKQQELVREPTPILLWDEENPRGNTPQEDEEEEDRDEAAETPSIPTQGGEELRPSRSPGKPDDLEKSYEAEEWADASHRLAIKSRERRESIAMEEEEESARKILESENDQIQRTVHDEDIPRGRTPPEPIVTTVDIGTRPISPEKLETSIDDPVVLHQAKLTAQIFGISPIEHIHSKDWKFRQTGFEKIIGALPALFEEKKRGENNGQNVSSLVDALFKGVLSFGASDNVAEVVCESLKIVKALKDHLFDDKDSSYIDSKEMCAISEDLIRGIIDRLGDTNSSVAESSLSSLLALSRLTGIAFVAQIALRRLHKWEEKNSRAVANRLKLLNQLLTDMLATTDRNNSAGILASSSLKFAYDCGSFEDSVESSIQNEANHLENVALEAMGSEASEFMREQKGTSVYAQLLEAEKDRHKKLEDCIGVGVAKISDLEKLNDNMLEARTKVQASVANVDSQIDRIFDVMQASLIKRRDEVKSMLSDIRSGKEKVLTMQSDEMADLRNKLQETCRMARDALNTVHREEYSALVEPITQHLEMLSAAHDGLKREPGEDSSVSWISGGTEKVFERMISNFGALHTSSDVVPGLESDDLDVEMNANPDANTDADTRIHLTVKSLLPKNNLSLDASSNGQAGDGTPKDTFVVEVRSGTEWDCSKNGNDGEILGRVIIVNAVERPPRDAYTTSQFFESLYTHVNSEDDKTIRNSSNGVPTTRVTKLLKFNGESKLAAELRLQAEEAKDFEWKEAVELLK